MASSTRRYVDLDFGFHANPVTDDVSKKVDDDAIKQSLKNLILMRRYDCPFHPEVCSQVQDSLFEIITPLTASTIRRAITYTIENFEPRVIVNDVVVEDDSIRNRVNITIDYTIKATGETSSYFFAVNRNR